MINKSKILYFLVLFVSLFFSIKSINAGVCKDYDLDPTYGTCDSKSLTFTSMGTLDNIYFMRPGYNTNNGNMAFCLDPGSKSPIDVYLNTIREISNNGDTKAYDEGVYKIYQSFYNDLLYSYNNDNLNTTSINNYRAYFQNALRTWTYKSGFAYTEESDVKYEVDAENYKSCAYYVDNTLISENKKTVEECFGSQERLNVIKKMYGSKDKELLWDNPLKISTDFKEISKEDGSKTYKFEFNVSFTDGTNHFFNSLYSKGIEYLNLSSANFSLLGIKVNDVDCNLSTCLDYSEKAIITTKTDSEQFYVELSEEQYKKYVQDSGNNTINVTMNYSYQHPLNIENLYIARYDLTSEYQRMLVIEDYVHKDSVSIEKEVEFEDEPKKCDISKFNNLTDYLEHDKDCCATVKIDELDDDQLEVYNNFCKEEELEKVCDPFAHGNNLESFLWNNPGCCDVLKDKNLGNYQETYNDVCGSLLKNETVIRGQFNDCDDADSPGKITKISTQIINDYCYADCEETITFSNFSNPFNVDVGKYFILQNPSLTATKTCSYNFSFDLWDLDYKKEINDVVDAVNESRKMNSLYEIENCVDVLDGYYNGIPVYSPKCWYDYKYNFTSVALDGYKIVDSSQISGTYRSGLSYELDVDALKKRAKNKVDAEKSDVTNLFNVSMKSCESELYPEKNNEATKYYDLYYDLNFYYEQTLPSGQVWNNERNAIGGIDDSKMSATSTKSTDTFKIGNTKYSNYDDLPDYTYSTGSNSSRTHKFGITNNQIVRSVTYSYYYQPKHNKYVDAFSGVISSNRADLRNPVLLEHAYDIDIRALAKDNNKFKYVFGNLGDHNIIYSYFAANNELEKLDRVCTYKTENDIVETYEDGTIKLKLAYRIVEPSNIDPNSRLVSGEGFRNWKNSEKALAVKNKIESDAVENKTYSSENLEYSFELDSATLKEIRSHNDDKSNKYSDFELKCDGYGNKCKSDFVYKYAVKNQNGNLIGRETWKEYIKDVNGNCTIDGKIVQCP